MRRAEAHFVECSPVSGTDISRIVHVEGDGGTPAVPATYKFTYISESGVIWGIPVGDGVMLGSLDVGGEAVDKGDGTVGLPFLAHTFTAGETIRISGTTNYNDSYTVLAETTVNQLLITETYNAETFDGTEIIVKYYGSLSAGYGCMIQDSSGNLYVPQGGGITKIEPDGTRSAINEWSGINTRTKGIKSIKFTSDETCIYTLEYDTFNLAYVYKFVVTTGAVVWANPSSGYGPGASMGGLPIDADDNVYTPTWTGSTYGTSKYAASNGTRTNLTLMGEGKGSLYSNVAGGCGSGTFVDDDMGIVIGAGQQSCQLSKDETLLYNLAVRTFDNSKGAQMAVGGTWSGANDSTYGIGNGMVVTRDGYIYVISYTPGATLYKIEWDEDEQTLTVVDSAAGPTYGCGIYFDLYGNLVVVNQNPNTPQDDVLYFYDTDLNYLSKIENMYTTMFREWQPNSQPLTIYGDTVFDGILGVAGVNGTDEYWQIFDSDGDELLFTHLIGETVCILADGVVYPSRVVDENGRIDASDFSTAEKLHIGLNYESKLKPMKPLSQLDMMAKRATCKQMGLSFHNTDDTEGRSTDIADTGVRYGVRDDDMKQIDFNDAQWKNKCDIDDLFTGSVNVSVPDGFSANLPLQLITDSPLPCVVRAMIPKVDVGD